MYLTFYEHTYSDTMPLDTYVHKTLTFADLLFECYWVWLCIYDFIPTKVV